MDIDQAAEETPQPMMGGGRRRGKGLSCRNGSNPRSVARSARPASERTASAQVGSLRHRESNHHVGLVREEERHRYQSDSSDTCARPACGVHCRLAQAIWRYPARVVQAREEMLLQLVQKNVFVFTINIAGLAVDEGTTTSVLWEEHRSLALDVAKRRHRSAGKPSPAKRCRVTNSSMVWSRVSKAIPITSARGAPPPEGWRAPSRLPMRTVSRSRQSEPWPDSWRAFLD